jgi:YHS domain-containing protein
MRSIGGVVAGLVVVAAAVAGDEGAKSRREGQEALRAFGPLVGSWRGTGQLQRGKSAGAWTEAAEWAWKLTSDSAALEITVPKGKHLKSGLLKPGTSEGHYVLEATLADGSKRTFAGKLGGVDKPLVLTSDAGGDGPKRVTLTIPNDLRFLLLFESKTGSSFTRLGEVGFTRNGVAFAAGQGGPVCVVTGGRGTTQVSYQGKTYWVCCSGCKDLFNQDPAAILAEAAARDAKK